MCRKQHLQGWCMIALGFGLLLGRCLQSWFVCAAGGLALVVLGFCVMRRR